MDDDTRNCDQCGDAINDDYDQWSCYGCENTLCLICANLCIPCELVLCDDCFRAHQAACEDCNAGKYKDEILSDL